VFRREIGKQFGGSFLRHFFLRHVFTFGSLHRNVKHTSTTVSADRDLSQRIATPHSRQKVQVAPHFRTVSTSSVPFLIRGCPNAQLFSPFHRASFKPKPKNEIAITIAQLPLPPGAAAANPHRPPRPSPVPDRQSRPAFLSSLSTSHSSPPDSIASET
jgi:hypothetical protein